MPGVILTVLDHPAAAGALLAAARRLAALTGAGRINALLVRTPPEASIAQSEEILTAHREAALRAVEARRANAVRTIFDTWLPTAELVGIEAEWIDVDGIAELIVEERGCRSDFLVIEQPARRDYGTSWHALRAALFATGRPVLVVPAAAAEDFGRRVAIAWRPDERTTQAVLAALRCLGRAESVMVLAGIRDVRAGTGNAEDFVRAWRDRGVAHAAYRSGSTRRGAARQGARIRRRHAGDGRLSASSIA